MDLDNILSICLPDVDNSKEKHDSKHILQYLINTCGSVFLNFIPCDSIITLVTTSPELFDSIVNQWNHLWCNRAIESIGYIQQIRKQRHEILHVKMFHLYFTNENCEWWYNNHMAYLFHIYAHKNAGLILNIPFNLSCKIQSGQIFDIQDAYGIWNGAVVIKIQQSDEFLIQVRFFGWSLEHTEWINLSYQKMRVAPFGMHSLQWSRSAKIKPNQYCLVNRNQLLSSMNPNHSLDSLNGPIISGYNVATIHKVFRSDDSDKLIIQIKLYVINIWGVCNKSNTIGCPRHPLGCKSINNTQMYLIYAHDYELIPLNDLTALVFLNKCILDDPFLGYDLSREYYLILEQAKKRFNRIILNMNKKKCVYCNNNHEYYNQLYKMNAKIRPWTVLHDLKI